MLEILQVVVEQEDELVDSLCLLPGAFIFKVSLTVFRRHFCWRSTGCTNKNDGIHTIFSQVSSIHQSQETFYIKGQGQIKGSGLKENRFCSSETLCLKYRPHLDSKCIISNVPSVRVLLIQLGAANKNKGWTFLISREVVDKMET